MKALFIVDVQNDFCPGGALAVQEGDKVIPVINRLMDRFGTILASKDNHPEHSKHFEAWPVHCVKGTPGAEFHSELNTNKIEQVFYKGTGIEDDGYSAFEATNLDLEFYLKEKGVNELYITGLATDYCVKHTAIESEKRGFTTYLIEDAIKGVNNEKGDADRAILEMKNHGVKLIKSTEI